MFMGLHTVEQRGFGRMPVRKNCSGDHRLRLRLPPGLAQRFLQQGDDPFFFDSG